MVDAFLRVLGRLRDQGEVARLVAAEAADRIDPQKHVLLRQPADEARPEYVEIHAILRDVHDAHPEIHALLTETAVDARRCMIVVDSDADPETRVHLGTISFAEDMEFEVFSGRVPVSNVIGVDRWGTWISGAVPIRDKGGAVVGLVCASVTPAEALRHGGLRSDAAAAFAELTRSAAERLTWAEIDAVTDGLTGLYNRRYLRRRLVDEVRAAIDRESELSLLFCDIDHFKDLNDRFGHAEGDEALKGVAEILNRSIRQIDLAARHGGDEFTIFLTDTGSQRAREVAERLRSAVADGHLQPNGEDLTISIGIATLPHDGRTAEELLERADRAMYEAKHSGRNRCVCFADCDASARSRRAGAPSPPGASA
jgi:diguanylate cyclase (GGDEF)-like protein